jgi:surface carbohydrate biosynthesis protein
MKPRIYLQMEVKKRELDARIYFALKASLQDFSIVIGAKSKLFDNRNRIRKGIVLFKSLGRNNLDYIQKYKKLGFLVGALDEEAMMFFSDGDYIERIHRPCLEAMDIFFCWGENDYKAIIQEFPNLINKIYITGNSRIDVLKKPLNQKYFDRAKKIKEQHGKFILVNTMFSKANNYQLIMSNKNYIEALIEDGYNPEGLKVTYAKKYLKFQQENLKLLKNFLTNFAKKNQNKKIIIRPHPGEYFGMWINFANITKNIEVIIDDESTCSWIIAANKCVSSNCTTSLESYLLNKISANYKVYENEDVEFKLPKLTSINIKKDEELTKFLEEDQSHQLDRDFTNNLAKKSIHNFGENECSVENFIKFLNSNNLIKQKLLSFNTKDKFSGFFENMFLNLYFYARFIYRKIFTKQDKILDIFLKKKFARLEKNEIQQTLDQYKNQLKIVNDINLREIYPQVFEIKEGK